VDFHDENVLYVTPRGANNDVGSLVFIDHEHIMGGSDKNNSTDNFDDNMFNAQSDDIQFMDIFRIFNLCFDESVRHAIFSINSETLATMAFKKGFQKFEVDLMRKRIIALKNASHMRIQDVVNAVWKAHMQ
jgi:hypothetical protein